MKRIMTPKEKKYLPRVLDQLVNETIIDYDDETVHFPFSSPPFLLFPFSHLYTLFLFSSLIQDFEKHCFNIYGLNVYEISNIWKQYKKIIEYKIGQPKKDLNESDDMEWIKNISDTQLISSLLIYYSIDQLNLLTDVEKLLWDYRNKSDGKSYNTSSISRPGTIFGTYNEHKIKRWNDILKRENCIGVLQVIYNGRELHMIPIYNLEDYKERVNKFSKVLENNNYIGIIKPEDLLHGH